MAPALSYGGLAAALWAALALVSYVQIRPLDLTNHHILSVTLVPLAALTARGLFAHAGELGAAAALISLQLAAMWGGGAPATAWLGVTGRRPRERTFYAVLLGLGAYGLVAWAAGALGFYTAGMYAALLAAGITAALLASRRSPPRLPHPFMARPPGWVLIGLGAVALTQAGSLLSAASPPHISDESIYHLGFARWDLWTRKAVAWPSNMLEFNPQLATMVYGTPLAFGLEFGVKGMHWVLALVAAWGLWHLLDRQPAWARRAALLATLTVPATAGIAGRGFNDLFLIAYAAAAMLAAQRAARSGGREATALVVLAGVFTGLAGSSKYTGLLTGLMLIPFLGPRRLAIAAAAAAVTIAPWFARNWILIGNPVFPFFWRILGGLGWDEHQDWRLKKDQMQGEFIFRQRLLNLPVQLWNTPILGAGSGPDGIPGALMGMTLPLVLLGASWRDMLALALYFLPVSFTASGLRFLLPLAPLMTLIAARRIGEVRAGRRLAGAAAAGFCALLWFQAVEYYPAFWQGYDDPLPVLLGQESEARWQAHALYPPIYFPPSYPQLMAAIDRSTPPGARVLVLGGYGGTLWMPRRAYFNPLQGRPLPMQFAREAATPEGIARRFRQLGITHVVVNRLYNDIYFDFWKMWDWKAGAEAVRWRDYWHRYPVRIWHRINQFEVYALSHRPGPPSRELVPGLQDEGYKLLSYMIRKGDYQQSDAFLQSMLAMFPGDPAFWFRAEETALHKSQPAAGREYAGQVERLAPGTLIALRARAAVAGVEGRNAEAAALMERVLAREAWDAQGWLDLAQIYQRMGLVDRAWWCAHTSADAKEFRPIHW